MKLWTGQHCWRPKSHPVTSSSVVRSRGLCSSLVKVLRRTVLTLNLYKQGWYEGRHALLSVSHLLLPVAPPGWHRSWFCFQEKQWKLGRG